VLAEKAQKQRALFIRCDVKALKPQENGAVHLETDIGGLQADKVVLCGGIWSTRLLKDFGISMPLVSECLSPLKLCHYFSVIGGIEDGSEGLLR